jgi:serine/threonine protein kinase
MSEQNRPLDPQKVLAEVMAGLRKDPAARPDLPPLPTAAELAPAFAEYRIEGLLGQGGMGAVYRAHHRKLDRPVALKILPKHLAADPAFEERFVREARTLAMLDHPHILRVYDFGEASGWFFLVTEFVDGANLRQMMQLARISPKEAIALVPQICDALQYAHNRGVVHRDIKPENLLVDAAGNVKVADFGLAKMLGVDPAPNLTRTSQILGTPHYMAPEQIEHPTAVDHRADIFSLGVVFYEMLTGQLPIGRFAPPSASGIATERLDPVVMKSLEREPGRRYQAVADLQQDLAARVHGDGKERPTLDEFRTRRIARLATSRPQPWHAATALGLGVLLSFAPLLLYGDDWTMVGGLLLTVSAILGFRGLAHSFQPGTGGQVALVAAAWFPVLLAITLVLGAMLEPLLSSQGPNTGAAFWLTALVVNLAVVAWIAVGRIAAQTARGRA